MMVAMEDHRSSKFPELTMSLFQQLKKVFKTETGQPFIFSGSGTGAWEAVASIPPTNCTKTKSTDA